MLSELIKGSVDVFVIFEVIFDDNYPVGQFFIDRSHASFRFDRHETVDRILPYVRELPKVSMLKLDFKRKNGS